jgi:hypothetical protein
MFCTGTEYATVIMCIHKLRIQPGLRSTMGSQAKEEMPRS